MVDDSHATGFVGPTGRGTPERHGVMGRVDIITSTLGKALGGGSGGFASGRQEIIELLRQRSRPYLFSNTLAPPIVGAALAVFDILESDDRPRRQLAANTEHLRTGLSRAGFDLKPGEHPIVPVMIGDAHQATALADRLLDKDIYVIGFSFPVVPRGQARVRVQLSAAHSTEDVSHAIAAFTETGRELGLIKAER
jgi:glycine C-acetyltransferase